MDYFSIRKQFICPTFDLEVEEAAFFEKYYAFLDRSGVGEIIRKHIRNDGSSGGRPNVNYYNLFAVILYGFSHGRSTLRDLEDACWTFTKRGNSCRSGPRRRILFLKYSRNLPPNDSRKREKR